jgi:hypothetical protein
LVLVMLLQAGNRSDEYKELKEKWQQKCLAMLWRFYPQLKGKQVGHYSVS